MPAPNIVTRTPPWCCVVGKRSASVKSRSLNHRLRAVRRLRRTARCRGVIEGRDWRRPELQRRYRGYFSWYLQRRSTRRDHAAMRAGAEADPPSRAVVPYPRLTMRDRVIEAPHSLVEGEDVAMGRAVLASGPRRRWVVLMTGLAGGYLAVVRPRLLCWGATDDEVRGQFPGAEIIPGGTRSATMAVTIDAPPSRVWPWLVQMGADRAGWYSWDRLDNFGHRSADRIHPEWQAISLGDRLAAKPDGSQWWEVAALEPTRFLGLRMSLDLLGRPFDPTRERPRYFTTRLGVSSSMRWTAIAPGWWSAVTGHCGRSGCGPS
jgi:hypothetical protein